MSVPYSGSSILSDSKSTASSHGETSMMDLLRSYENELQQSLDEIQNSQTKPLQNSQQTFHAGKMQKLPHQNQFENPISENDEKNDNSSDLERELIQDAENNSHLSLNEIQGGFLADLNKMVNDKRPTSFFPNPISTNHFPEDDDLEYEIEDDMSGVISSSFPGPSDIHNYSMISPDPSKPSESSAANISILNYTTNDKTQEIAQIGENDGKNDDSTLSGSQFSSYFKSKSTLEPIAEDDDGEEEVPLQSHISGSQYSSFLKESNPMLMPTINDEDESEIPSNIAPSPIKNNDVEKRNNNNDDDDDLDVPDLLSIINQLQQNQEKGNASETKSEENSNIENESPVKSSVQYQSNSPSIGKYEKIANEISDDLVNESNKNTSSDNNPIDLRNSALNNLSDGKIISQDFSYEEEDSHDEGHTPLSLMEASSINHRSKGLVSSTENLENFVEANDVVDQKFRNLPIMKQSYTIEDMMKDQNIKISNNKVTTKGIPKAGGPGFTIQDMIQAQKSINAPKNQQQQSGVQKISNAPFTIEEMIKQSSMNSNMNLSDTSKVNSSTGFYMKNPRYSGNNVYDDIINDSILKQSIVEDDDVDINHYYENKTQNDLLGDDNDDGDDILSSFVNSQKNQSKGGSNLSHLISEFIGQDDELMNSDTSTRANNADNLDSIISHFNESNSQESKDSTDSLRLNNDKGGAVASSAFSNFIDALGYDDEEEEEEEGTENYTVIGENENDENVMETDVEKGSQNSIKQNYEIDEASQILSGFSDLKAEDISADFIEEENKTQSEKPESTIGDSILSDFANENDDGNDNYSQEIDASDFIEEQSSIHENSLESDFIESNISSHISSNNESHLESNLESNIGSNIESIISSNFGSNIESNIGSDFIDENDSLSKSSKSNNSDQSTKMTDILSSGGFIDNDDDFQITFSEKQSSVVDGENMSISISGFIDENSSNSKTSSSSRKSSNDFISNEASTFSHSVETSNAAESFSDFIESTSQVQHSSRSSSNNDSDELFDSDKIESFISEFIEEEKSRLSTTNEYSKSSDSSNSKHSKSSSSDANVSEFIDVESFNSNINSKSVTNESEFVTSDQESKTDSVYIESIESNKVESSFVDIESNFSNSSTNSSSSQKRNRRNKKSQSYDSDSDSDFVEFFSSQSSKSNAPSSNLAESDFIESINSINDDTENESSKTSYSKRSSSSGSNPSVEGESDFVDIESIHSKSDSQRVESSSIAVSDFNMAVESFNSSKSDSNTSSGRRRNRSNKGSKKEVSGMSIEIESFCSTTSALSKTNQSSFKGDIDDDFVEEFTESSSSRSSSHSKSSKSNKPLNSLSDEDFITADYYSSKSKKSQGEVESSFEFSENTLQNEKSDNADKLEPLPKLVVIHPPRMTKSEGQNLKEIEKSKTEVLPNNEITAKNSKQKQISVSSLVGSNSNSNPSSNSSNNSNSNHSESDQSRNSDKKKQKSSKYRSKSTPISLKESQKTISTVSILDAIDTESSSISDGGLSGEFIGTSENEERSVSLMNLKVPSIPKSLSSNLKQQEIGVKQQTVYLTPRRRKQNQKDDKENKNSNRVSNERLTISKLFDYPTKFSQAKNFFKNQNYDQNEQKEEEENDEIEVDDITASIIEPLDEKHSKHVTIIDLNNTKRGKLSMSPVMTQKDISPRRSSKTSSKNSPNISKSPHSAHSKYDDLPDDEDDGRRRRSIKSPSFHHHHHRSHRSRNQTEATPSFSKLSTEEKQRLAKTPQPQRERTRIANSNLSSSIRISQMPTTAELVDQNFINTLKSAKLSLQYIKESINASRQMRFTRQSAMDPFEYTPNPFSQSIA
ncbi:hypothetical protein TRFO_37059 [Tritrichomonas foetus]|uniref:Uncharacterized protein n=1 Tax=Tritrichomonas foetus TaxID=1144522 RepID=A0A1J4JC78_9EUKA|nr:hypothetical protein TRFO_37059 [Tritrichomonas foetus]|eukprot:OHS96744.1 hypothetical protein TRFO_37059 [Tritrichomonas foetus]